MKLRDSLVQHNSIVLQGHANTWQEAVALGTQRLETAGVVTPAYYDAILANVAELGPYFLLAPGLAMPHARPEYGVLQNGFALVTLKEPVRFGHADNDPVDLLITLAAVDARAHNEVGLMQVITLFDQADSFEQLRACRTVDDVLRVLDQTH
ncbi:PTS system ascorbate-specific IIA component [Silvimonas terrae]|uniref:Ascorbate-specific PTS system EIIA component n=1 Tax=Silvimonas terrae TaxID=300266 RepID=A0A840RHT3_9NEIS|nr:PTS ascorbate transporter subunit IIA [Silvimonas terrae]MBB5192000.1 PTS system ascorbate-specific IIA component [Silvimonas terrae]